MIMEAKVIQCSELSIKVRVPAFWFDKRVIEFVNHKNPCGTKHGWIIRRTGDPALHGDPERKSCKEYVGMVYIILYK